MKKDQIFLRPDRRSSDFEFDSEVAAIFDMLLRRVPFYAEQQRMINQVSLSTVTISNGFYTPIATIFRDMSWRSATTTILGSSAEAA